ncbi:alpha-L-arabinofuranosidase 1-like [Phoenix dactylifera]|uniref:Alpha-L-arabinofuranosidase 1-like n=1 Tax=Phoenix dactylifera TaxID=42345 RepID=A0A8B8ZV11_PHODC|nr:alpha-L-arabinofuranosidase 1-like [Phoenix dactylifera]
MPENMFGIFFEEINHAGAGGLWAELVSNRGFEAGGPNTPSNIDPWSIIGNESYIIVSTDRTSCFNRNKVALRMEVLCDDGGSNICPTGGVGIYNPGYCGMNIEQGKTYKVVLHVRSWESINLSVSLASSDGLQSLAAAPIIADTLDILRWTKFELLLESAETNVNSRLQLTTMKQGVIWLDQVSVMPLDTYMIYTSAYGMFSRAHQFDRTPRSGPKAFVSEYAVTDKDAGKGSLLAALAEAGFLTGLERNSDVVEMASYALLFVNANDRRWNPDAIVFNSWQQYGTPSYWMQQFFKESSGANLHPSTIQASSSNSLIASAITWQNSEDDSSCLKIKVVNFGNDIVNLKIFVTGLQNDVNSFGSKKTLLTSSRLTDENSFQEPNKVVPVQSMLPNAGTDMDVVIFPHSITSCDLLLAPEVYRSVI